MLGWASLSASAAFDVSDKNSLEHMKQSWVPFYEEWACEQNYKPVIMLMGCKADLVSPSRVVGRIFSEGALWQPSIFVLATVWQHLLLAVITLVGKNGSALRHALVCLSDGAIVI